MSLEKANVSPATVSRVLNQDKDNPCRTRNKEADF